MKFEDLRHHRAEQGGLCESFWRALCIICRSRLFASAWHLQFLQERGVDERTSCQDIHRIVRQPRLHEHHLVGFFQPNDQIDQINQTTAFSSWRTVSASC
jgi:hypothetical protein